MTLSLDERESLLADPALRFAWYRSQLSLAWRDIPEMNAIAWNFVVECCAAVTKLDCGGPAEKNKNRLGRVLWLAITPALARPVEPREIDIYHDLARLLSELHPGEKELDVDYLKTLRLTPTPRGLRVVKA